MIGNKGTAELPEASIDMMTGKPYLVVIADDQITIASAMENGIELIAPWPNKD